MVQKLTNTETKNLTVCYQRYSFAVSINGKLRENEKNFTQLIVLLLSNMICI